MDQQILKPKLTNREWDYLHQLHLNGNLPGNCTFKSDSTIEVQLQAVELLREHLTELLARKGFDESYCLTPEGKLIEDLIDRLYV